MIANYGFNDGSGEYYLTIDTAKCKTCQVRGCIDGCHAKVFEMEIDDWDDEVAVVKRDTCNRLKSICTECKPLRNYSDLLPCEKVCDLRAIRHFW
ncbi:hypothetical protein Desdi_0721 [Desulfitobacterium dichloroeliminans LMG P-21439]|uniref:4Fe-4S ferredoxin-type domain-containing protein n=1 Tax=Desulfitobacterium dichloroeliminans (strain LMG P-21439 / DCA1) TaxID=871963 RepID=L0F5M1_DESDL|nr:hypothetical protein [Desulfitobacterium dichloroeliminans]AGA68248.1 hypothetical protein Desdi_0721 [Desulfitobacterium dichloroeliminans LMG P-21439]